jgi:hypothetical protein
MKRALVLGDSFAFGLGVDDGERLSDLLGDDRLEVVNMGVTAWGTDQQLRALEIEGFDYSPDLVLLVVFPHNDLEDIGQEIGSSWPKPHFELEDGRLKLVPPSVTWDIHLRSVSYLAEIVYSQLRSKENNMRIAEAWKSRDTLPLFAAIIDRMAEECRARGVEVAAVIAYPPGRMATGPSEAERRVRAALERAGFATCDTFDAFREHTVAGESLYSSDGLHWNARGNAVAAAQARRLLVELGWVSATEGDLVGNLR